MSASVSEWPALVVDEVDEIELLHGTTSCPLPVKNIKIIDEKVCQIAVVSWRWDGKDKMRGSQNIYYAIRRARKEGIKYLFIDCVSIDQERPKEELIREVVAFSELYKSIPVIAVYNTVDQLAKFIVFDSKYTVYRPWIFNELRAMRFNPTRIFYVGRNPLEACTKDLIEQHSETDVGPLWKGFSFMLPDVWSRGYAQVILGVLDGTYGMEDVTDFKYILPALASVLDSVHEKMGRNDYLLTTALLCHKRSDPYTDYYHQQGREIIKAKFEKYTFIDKGWDSEEFYGNDIFLNRTKIARYFPFHTMLLPEPDAACLIFTTLGLKGSDYEDYSFPEEVPVVNEDGTSTYPRFEICYDEQLA